MKVSFFKNFLCIMLVMFSTSAIANAPEKPPKKWPCDQVYNPKLNLTAIWQGPSIEQELKDWWKDDDVIEYVNKLADPVLEESKGVQLIEEFVKKYSYFGLIKKSEQKQKLTFLFAGEDGNAAEREKDDA